MKFERLTGLRWFYRMGSASHGHRSKIRMDLRDQFKQHGISAEITLSPAINIEFSSPADEALFLMLYSDSV